METYGTRVWPWFADFERSGTCNTPFLRQDVLLQSYSWSLMQHGLAGAHRREAADLQSSCC